MCPVIRPSAAWTVHLLSSSLRRPSKVPPFRRDDRRCKSPVYPFTLPSSPLGRALILGYCPLDKVCLPLPGHLGGMNLLPDGAAVYSWCRVSIHDSSKSPCCIYASPKAYSRRPAYQKIMLAAAFCIFLDAGRTLSPYKNPRREGVWMRERLFSSAPWSISPSIGRVTATGSATF